MTLNDIDLHSIVIEKNVPLGRSSVGKVNKILSFVSSMASGDSFTVTGYECRKEFVTQFIRAKVPFITKLIEKPVSEDNNTYVYRIWVYQNQKDKISAKRQRHNTAFKGELK